MFKVNCGTYPIECLVYFGKPTKKIYKELRTYNTKEIELNTLKESFETSGAFSILFSSNIGLIWVHKEPKDIKYISILIHEISHFAFQIMNTVGIEYDKMGANEAFTYQIEYLSKQILSNIENLNS